MCSEILGGDIDFINDEYFYDWQIEYLLKMTEDKSPEKNASPVDKDLNQIESGQEGILKPDNTTEDNGKEQTTQDEKKPEPEVKQKEEPKPETHEGGEPKKEETEPKKEEMKIEIPKSPQKEIPLQRYELLERIFGFLKARTDLPSLSVGYFHKIVTSI